jgi:hypothetical protein
VILGGDDDAGGGALVGVQLDGVAATDVEPSQDHRPVGAGWHPENDKSPDTDRGFVSTATGIRTL